MSLEVTTADIYNYLSNNVKQMRNNANSYGEHEKCIFLFLNVLVDLCLSYPIVAVLLKIMLDKDI